MNKKLCVVAGVIFLMLNLASAAQAQSALDGFDPNANGAIHAVVTQPDGKILIGGDFTIVKGISRNRIARLNPDGTLDPAFDPNANESVRSIAVQADGKILAAGFFSGAGGIGGQTRNYIARLDATTGLADPSFNPNADNIILSIAVQPDGGVLVGGAFTSIGGQTRNCIARLNPATGLADSFNPNANSTVLAIAVVGGKILVGGAFNGANSIGGETRNYIARFDAATGGIEAWDPNPNFSVRSFAVQADGKILVGGDFSGANSIGGQTRNRIARLDAITGLADSFNPNASASVFAITVQPDGKILVGGSFNFVGGQSRAGIARLNPDGALDNTFNPNPNGHVFAIALQTDGKIVAGGNFTTFAPNGGAAVTRNNIARLEKDGSLDRTLDLSINAGSIVSATAVQPDGKILIGGSFTTVLGVARNNIVRLNTDGTLDLVFNPNSNDDVLSIALQADGKILVGGFFTTIGGQTRTGIARLDAITGQADSFNPNANSSVRAIAVQANGKILVAGGFTFIGGQARNRIARFDPISGAVDSFDPNANHDLYSIAVQADGKILAGGSFTTIGGQTRIGMARLDAVTGQADSFISGLEGDVLSIAVQADGQILAGGDFLLLGGQSRNRIARLDAATGSADSFDPNANGNVYSIAAQADGKVVIAGVFTTLSPNGGAAVTRNRIARLNADGTLDASFNPNADSLVRSIAIQADGKILAGGDFSGMGGHSRRGFARLSNDTTALQNIAVTQTSVTWTLGGSSPQFTRVTFESSTDNVNYTPLGNGTASGGNWTLSGLNLATGQNIYIRARGNCRSGFGNGSESIQESVRNVYLSAGPTPTASPTPTPTGTFTATSTPTSTATNTPTVTPTNTPTPPPGTVQVTAPTLNAAAGSSFNAPVSVSDTTGLNIQLYAFRISFNPAVIVPQNPAASATGTLSQGWNVTIDPNTPGEIEVTAAGPGPPMSGAGTLINLRFTVVGASGTSTSLFWNVFEFNAGTPNALYSHGGITVVATTPSISGTITYGNAIGNPVPPRFVKNVSLASTVGSPPVGPVITGTPGTYTLTGFGSGSYTIKPTKPGGANSAINSFDAARVAQGASGSVPFVSQNQRFVADASGNGTVSSNDAAKIAQFAAGLPITPPNLSGEWRFFVTGAPSPLPTPPQTYNDSRTYASVTSSLTGEDYVGLLVGDASGNWNPANHPRPAGKVESGQWTVNSEDGGPERGIEVKLPEMVTPLDKEIVVPVNVQGVADKGIISYEFNLRYDPTVIQPLVDSVDVAGTASRGLFVVTNPAEPGLLRVVIYGPMPIDEDGLLLNLRFTVVGAVGSMSSLTWERIMFNEGEPEVSVTDGRIELY